MTQVFTVSLLEAGLLMVLLVGTRVVVGRRMPISAVPAVLQRRVAVINRICPWLLAVAVTMVLVALVLRLVAA